ncbi:MAG: hypothetical protein ACRENW_04890, partial [Thermodesulfobacteriota bacterium]
TGLFGWTHFGNVVSNLAYVVVGIVGLIVVRPVRIDAAAAVRAAISAWFIGFILVAAGSAWYHSHPNDSTLVWDRAAMTIVFAAATALFISDRISARAGPAFLIGLIALGLASQIYWHLTGDLRIYRFVEYLPFVIVPAICLLFPGRLTTFRHALAIIAVFAAATLCEHFDHDIHRLFGGAVSGHAIKHIVSAAAGWLLVPMIRGDARRSNSRPPCNSIAERASGNVRSDPI